MSSTTVDRSAEAKEPFRRIIVGLDGSEQSREILKTVSIFVKKFDSKVIACNVSNVPTSVQGNDKDGFAATNDERNMVEAIRVILKEELGDDGDRAEVRILHGDPAERICEYADYTDSDLIIVGSRGQGALKRALLGSVSGAVAAKSKRTVLIIK